MISLVPLKRADGRALWLQVFPNCEYPRLSTRWYEARIGKTIVGWCCCRYLASRPNKKASLVSEGVYVDPAFRGRGLQNELRTAMVNLHRTSKSGRKIVVQTYVSAENLPSLKNAIRAGLVPYKVVREGASVFIHLEGTL